MKKLILQHSPRLRRSFGPTMAATDALKLVRDIIGNVESSPNAAAASIQADVLVDDAKRDYTWDPLIPPGHTSFSWTGEQGKFPNWQPLTDVRGAELKASVEGAGSSRRKSSTTSKETPVAAEVKTPEPQTSSEVDPDTEIFSKLDIRVGTIVEAAKHPNAEALYLEKIDLGESDPRQVISGLVAHIPLDQFVNSKVLVFANLKPSKLRGEDSFGMVFCACSPDKSKVELIRPPANSKNGERVTLAGVPVASLGAPEANINPKKKSVWDTAQPLLKTDAKGLATFNGRVLRTSGGECKAQTLTNSTIS
jgi:methionine--tRNA ligase beta chain